MAVRHEPVRIECNGAGEIVVGVRRAVEYAEILSAVLARHNATWEPHDWSDFD